MTSRRFRHFVCAAGFAGLLFTTFANYTLNELGHDEGMYLGASYLAIDHELYREVGYFQAPNLPLLLSAFYAWTGVTEYLLWGRAVSFAHHALTLALLAAIAWHYTRSTTVSFLFTMWMGLNGFLFGAGYSIDNTTYASTYWLAGYYLWVRAREHDWPSSWMLTAGVLVALAPGFKLTYFPLLACFVVVLAIDAPRRALGLFLAGTVVGLAPSLYMLADRSTAFWFDNVTWHRALRASIVDELGPGAMVAAFAGDAFYYLTRVAWLATHIMLVPVAIGLVSFGRKKLWSVDRALLTLFLAASILTVAGMGVVRFWYLQPVAIAGALWVPSVYSQLESKLNAALCWMLVVAAAASAWSQTSALRQAHLALEMRRWAPIRYARTAKVIAALTTGHRAESVAVIGNPAVAYGVEGALPLARSAATGAFVSVSSPMVTGGDRIATYEGLSGNDWEMIIATTDYVTPRSGVDPATWCDAPLPSEDGGAILIATWCAKGYQCRVFGEGPSRVVVFYREP